MMGTKELPNEMCRIFARNNRKHNLNIFVHVRVDNAEDVGQRDGSKNFNICNENRPAD
jgi:hypothetical protein